MSYYTGHWSLLLIKCLCEMPDNLTGKHQFPVNSCITVAKWVPEIYTLIINNIHTIDCLKFSANLGEICSMCKSVVL